MEKLKIDKRRDLIIVEKSNGNEILKGSRFYCGCCGGVLGEAKKKIIFPFSSYVFIKSIKNKTFESRITGLYHKNCGHSMFGFSKVYGFVRLETYVEQVPQS